jgi:hypothetical protein
LPPSTWYALVLAPHIKPWGYFLSISSGIKHIVAKPHRLNTKCAENN